MKTLPAYYNGIQRAEGNIPDFELWTPVIDWEGFPAGSTVSRQTIEKAGYVPLEIKTNL
jgi:hypothetical protein